MSKNKNTRLPKDYSVIKKIDENDPINLYGCVEWGRYITKSYKQLRKELEEKFPKEQGYIISIAPSFK